MTMEKQELLLLGEISGKLDGVIDQQRVQGAQIGSIDERLRTVEQKAAVTGAISGGAMSIGIALVIEGMKQWLASKGGGQ